MLDSLKQAGKNIGRELGRTWENLSEGWRELLSSSGDALTPFTRDKDQTHPGSAFPRWSLLAGEVEETEQLIVVRVEAPGMEKDDFRITIEGNQLCLSGGKNFERESSGSTYHIMERAYGAFKRTVPLPANVDMDKAEANYKNGVLCIRLPKLAGTNLKTVSVS